MSEEKKQSEKKERNGRAGIVLLAGMICMASVVLLLLGMNVYARRQGNHTEQTKRPGADGTERMADVIGEVLADSEETSDETVSPADDTGMPYASVPILTWDDYYALGPAGKGDPNITGQGIMGTWSENELTMEEAGMLGLREIYRVFGDDVDYSEMYLTMMLQNAANRKDRTDTWYGYMMNSVNGDTPEPGFKMRSYSFEINAVTGEIRLLLSSVDEREAEYGQGELVGREELISSAERYLEELGIEDPSKLTVGTVRMDGESPDGSGVIYSKDGEYYLEIWIWPYSGRLRGYGYHTKV